VVFVVGAEEEAELAAGVRRALAAAGVEAPRAGAPGEAEAEGYGRAVGELAGCVSGADAVLVLLSRALARSHRAVLAARYALDVGCPSPPLSRTEWARRVLIGHAASITPY
jgi:hypothetical protein